MFRKGVAGAGVLLVLFHVWLLSGQAWDGRLMEPGLLLRWLVAAGLVAALVYLRRQGASLFIGRKAVSVWLLAGLLHGPAVAGQLNTIGVGALPEVAVTLAQIAVATAAIGLGLLLILHAVRRRGLPIPRRHLVSMGSRPLGALSSNAFLLSFAPRPPPRT